MSVKRFVEWEEHFVSHDRGSRIVHYYLKDRHGNASLAVVGTERSVRHMVYVVSDEFLHLQGLGKPSNSSFKWRSRREVVDWLTSLLSKPRPSATSSGDYATKISRHDISRFSDVDASNGEELEEHSSYLNNYKGKFSRKIRGTSKGISWLGAAWSCRKRLRHYESFRRSGVTISVNDFVYVMAEEKNHHIACLEDMYEDRKAQKKVRVRWFHRTNEVVGTIPPPAAYATEVFITPFRQVLSVECVDGLAIIMTPEHYEKCLVKLPSVALAQIHVCHRQFDNEGVKPFNLSEMQGYWHQKILESIDIAFPRDSSRHDPTSDSLDMDEEEDADIGTPAKKCPRKNRCSRKRTVASDRVCGGNVGEKQQVLAENLYRLTVCDGANRDLNNCPSEKKSLIMGSNESRKQGGAWEPEPVSFDIGDKIELLCLDSGIRGCWFRCTITEKVPHRMKVWYEDVLNEDGSDNLEEWVPSSRISVPDKLGMRIRGRPTIRPYRHDTGFSCSFEVGTAVDAWWNDGWWEGVVVMIKEPLGEVQVYFPGENVSSTFQKCALRLSRDWVNNQWVDVKMRVDLLETLVSSDDNQVPDTGRLYSSTLRNDDSAHLVSAELGDHIDDSDRELSHVFSQVALLEYRKLVTRENTDNGNYDTVRMDYNEEEMCEDAGDCRYDSTDISKSMSMRLNDSVGLKTDAFLNVTTPIKQDDISILSDLRKPVLHGASLVINSGEVSNTEGLRSDLRWKSSRKRQRSGESALLSRPGSSCGKEESKRLTGCKLVDMDDVNNDTEPLMAGNIEDLANRHEDLAETKKLNQGHENLKPIHGPSMGGSLFMGSMPIANLVMSR